MADYIYLLENRLSRAQRDALLQVREAARNHGMTVFLVGGAVRDLTSGAPIRDLDVAVQGDARLLAKDLGAHAKLVGTHDPMQVLYFSFPGGVRLEIGSTLNVTYPKPGKPVVQPASVLEDLRRRDFTANAMAISLNEGSYGLLMDPTNGVADVENRELRLLSNYGFLEEPSRMIRAVRLSARLSWQMEERTRTRYENAKAEGYISALGDWERRYEAEAIFREEDPLYSLRKLESEGWMQTLSPALASAKVDEGELDRLRDLVSQLNVLGLFPDTSAAAFPLVTAKLNATAVAELKQKFALPGFAGQIEALDDAAKALTTEFTSKGNAAPSASWKMLMAAQPEAVLWMAFSSRSAAAQAKLKLFFNEWPQARTKIPYQQMQEMRITPELPGYDALLEDLFFAAMDGKLDTPEATKTFLEPFSPPAAPPPPTLRRRAVKRESKTSKSRPKKTVVEAVGVSAEAADASDSKAGAEVLEAPATPIAPEVPAPKPSKPVAPKTAGSGAGAPAKQVPGSGAERTDLPGKKAAAAPGAAASTPAARASSPTASPAKGASTSAPSNPPAGKTSPAATKTVKPKVAAAPVKSSSSKAAGPSSKTATKAPAKAAVKLPAKASGKAAPAPVAKTPHKSASVKAGSAKAASSKKPSGASAAKGSSSNSKVKPGGGKAKATGGKPKAAPPKAKPAAKGKSVSVKSKSAAPQGSRSAHKIAAKAKHR